MNIDEIAFECQKITTDKYEIYIHSDKLLCVHYFENTVIEVPDIKEAIKTGMQLSPSNSTKLIVLVDLYVDVTKEAREFAQNNMRILKAEAHVFPSLANKILFNLFIKFRKNSHPLKAFAKTDEAIDWLSKH